VFFFSIFYIEILGNFFFELAKLVKFTLEKKFHIFPNFLLRKSRNFNMEKKKKHWPIPQNKEILLSQDEMLKLSI
jgi:hypothetical protein